MAPPAPSVVRIDGPWRHTEVHANGIRFHVVEADPHPHTDTPPSALPLVVLLHGFGSFWWSWRHQLRGLTGARVVAVDLRGYGGSDKPPRGYDGWTLAGDTAGLIRALGHTSATLVGHADVRAPRATSTSCTNVVESSTARSASILRLMSMPALFSPCMNWL